MMFYDRLNQLIEKIEQNLTSEIDYQKLAKGIGINLITLQKTFPLVADISLADYVRRRRLTLAGKDLAQSDLRIIDVAMKYGYNSAAAFSRAFYNFHQVKPSEVKLNPRQLKYYPKLVFTKPDQACDLAYEIVKLSALDLCGLKILSDHGHIKQDAPDLFEYIKAEYPELPHPDYGILEYGGGRDDDDRYEYYALWSKDFAVDHPDFLNYHLPAARWLKFKIASQKGVEIQAASTNFYEKFLPTCEYRLRPEPDLEYYHDGQTDFLVPIY